jgi:integrase
VATRRVTGEGSIYQRKSDGRWVGVVDLGWVNGRRVRKTVTAATLKELRPKFKALKGQVESGVADENMTVEQWMEKWLRDVAGEKNRPSTLRTYRMYVSKWINPHVGRVRLGKLRPDHIRSMLAAMRDAKKSNATRRQVLAILRRALAVAEQDQLIGSNPAARVDAPPVGQGSHGKFTLAEARKILAALDVEGVSASRWTCALLAGLRQGEALGLRWENVDLDARRILVCEAVQQIKGEGLVVVPLKSQAAYRSVPMVMPVYEALLREPSREGYVWGGEKPTGPRKDWQAWVDLLKMTGVEHRPLHAARATCGSLLLEAGVPDKIIAEILGHSQVKITQDHYLHGDDRMHVDAMGRLDELLTPNPPAQPDAAPSA